jgi:hypothetical protein
MDSTARAWKRNIAATAAAPRSSGGCPEQRWFELISFI